MTIERLEKAFEIKIQIDILEQALKCFEYTYMKGGEQITMSLKPRIIIEFDDLDDGRDELKLPVHLNPQVVDYLKKYIAKELQIKINQFNLL